jgi:alpha-galactosidase
MWKTLAIASLSAATIAVTMFSPRAISVTQQEMDLLHGAEAPPNAIWIDSLDLSKMVQRRQTPRAGRSLAGGAGGRRGAGAAAGPPGSPITLGGVTYEHGIGTLSINELIIDLKGQATRFLAVVGLNDNAGRQGSVTVEIWLDNKKVLISDVLKVGSPPLKVDVDLTGARFLELLIDDGNDVSTGDYADWAGGLIFLKADASAKPETWTFPAEPASPIASGWPATPRINPPRITGGTPGRPLVFRIPATGEAPLTFAARNLPEGLVLDSKTGVITGAIARDGRTDVEVSVTNARGRATRSLTIVGGKDALALTPPLGWNSWNVWGRSVDDAKVRAAADAMESSGLAAHG